MLLVLLRPRQILQLLARVLHLLELVGFGRQSGREGLGFSGGGLDGGFVLATLSVDPVPEVHLDRQHGDKGCNGERPPSHVRFAVNKPPQGAPQALIPQIDEGLPQLHDTRVDDTVLALREVVEKGGGEDGHH